MPTVDKKEAKLVGHHLKNPDHEDWGSTRRRETKLKLRFLLSCIDNAAKLETAINTMSKHNIDFNEEESMDRMDAAVHDEIAISKFVDKMPRTYGWKLMREPASLGSLLRQDTSEEV
tara:strand:+ start:951 stop:1301 length:351 start_codon:yes stop_codon:yes gene_type:complete